MPADAVHSAELNQKLTRSSPYPGLRPFQAEDSEYFFGRDTQISEVVTRLRENRFVAVIGGSGSGKSSLVLAGAIPRLRAFAIKEAGDFWIPVIAMPGTKHAEGDSPLQRLAHKFCLELSEKDAAHDRVRLSECVELLRHEQGLGALVQRFGRDFKNADGIDLSRPDVQVNFLFLIDQFEELFHSSNLKEAVAEDCRHLVDRIVEQFKKPHSQVCVALTMRSEYLNDCPRYEDLPDAINATVYLVKRLNGDQLREAIEQPARHFLRKYVAAERYQARLRGQVPSPDQKWQNNISFEAGLIDRMLTDSDVVLSKQDHADHLPMLQHLLFWIWAAASARCMPASIPDMLRLADLKVAVNPAGCTDNSTLNDVTNTLTACLENRCEAIYGIHSDRQTSWKDMFCSLAFKEPDTGTYTQQHSEMKTLRARLNVEIDDSELVKNYLSPWLTPHSYLRWDTASQTLKVAHETLIRRWERFRKWIDDEDYQFQDYLRLLEDCDSWRKASNEDKHRYLSTGEILRRYEDARLPEALENPNQVARFGELLVRSRDGQRLYEAAKSARNFLAQSRAERDRSAQKRKDDDEQQRRDREKAAVLSVQNKVARFAILVVVSVAVCLLIYALAETSLATKRSTLDDGYRKAIETIAQHPSPPNFGDFSEPQRQLRNVLDAAKLFDSGRELRTELVETLNRAGRLYQKRLADIQRLHSLSETRAIGSFSIVLQNAIWEVPDFKGSTNPQTCVANNIKNGGKPENVPFYSYDSITGGKGLTISREGKRISLFTVTEHSGGNCSIGKFIYSTTGREEVRVGVVENTPYFVFEFSRYYQFYTIDHDDSIERDVATPRVVIEKPQSMWNKFSLPKDITLLASVHGNFATDIKLGDKAYRLFDTVPQRVEQASWMKKDAMQKANPEACEGFSNKIKLENYVEVWELIADKGERRTHCLFVSAPSGDVSKARFLATLYAFSGERFKGDEKGIRPLLLRFDLGKTAPTDYKIDTESGWLAFKIMPEQWRSIPWSHKAWRSLAESVVVSGESGNPSTTSQKFNLDFLDNQ